MSKEAILNKWGRVFGVDADTPGVGHLVLGKQRNNECFYQKEGAHKGYPGFVEIGKYALCCKPIRAKGIGPHKNKQQQQGCFEVATDEVVRMVVVFEN